MYAPARDDVATWPRQAARLWRPLAVFALLFLVTLALDATASESFGPRVRAGGAMTVAGAVVALVMVAGAWALHRQNMPWAGDVAFAALALLCWSGWMSGSVPGPFAATAPVVVMFGSLFVPMRAEFRMAALVAFFLALNTFRDRFVASDGMETVYAGLLGAFFVATWLAMQEDAPWRTALSVVALPIALLEAGVALDLVASRPGAVAPEIVRATLFAVVAALWFVPAAHRLSWPNVALVARPSPDV